MYIVRKKAMRKTETAYYLPSTKGHHLAVLITAIGLSYVASYVVMKGIGNIGLFVGTLTLVAVYIAIVSKWPEMSFPIFLVASTEVLGLMAYEYWPVIRFSFGSISILDLLIIYPFLQVQYWVLSGKIVRTHTVFHNPLIYFFIVLGIAIGNSILIKHIPYREVIRGARPYMYYLLYFVLVYSLHNRAAFYRLLKATTVVVVLGCFIQIGQYLFGPSQEELVNMLRGLIIRHTYIDIKTLMVITVGGKDVVRFLMRTGNFPVLLFFVALFSLVRATKTAHQALLAFLMIISGISIFLTYGRTLFLMMAIGMIAGIVLEVDKRKRYVKLLGITFGSTIVVFAFLGILAPGSENILAAIWERFTGILQDVKYSRGTFGTRLELVQFYLPQALKHLPLGMGITAGGVWDVGILCFLIHFGIFGPFFYIWILRNAIVRVLELYRRPLSPHARSFMKGFACYLLAQLSVILIQDPFPVPVGILLVVFSLVCMECVARFGGPDATQPSEDEVTPPPRRAHVHDRGCY